MEYLLLDPILKSNLLHYLRNNGRALLQLRFLHIALSVVLTKVHFQHPSDSLAHPKAKRPAVARANDIRLRDDVLLQINS